MHAGFIKFNRTEATEELLRYPASFTLLAQIAFRARREAPKINPYNMQPGEAMVGDYAAVGLTRQQFRQAIDRLEKGGFITTRPTNKGTIAKLCNTEVYDINTAAQQPTTQPTREPASNQQGNHPTTTNKNDKKEKKEKMEEGMVGQPASQPVFASQADKPAVANEPAKFFPDEAAVFTLAGFTKFVTSMSFGNIDRGVYLPEIQRKADLMQQQRDETGWENFVLDYLKRERAAGKLLYRDPADQAAATRTTFGPAPTVTRLPGNSYDLKAAAASNKIPTD